MEDKYAECHKVHYDLGGKIDGCQQFMAKKYDELMCHVCDCGRNYHRKVEPTIKFKTEVVYTKCHKIQDFKSQSVDGCQEFTPAGKNGTAEALTCAVCRCHRGFHRNEITTQVPSTS
ncbi:hypothetical protein ACS0TY_024241 [Phlomoides rotata]